MMSFLRVSTRSIYSSPSIRDMNSLYLEEEEFDGDNDDEDNGGVLRDASSESTSSCACS